MKPPILIGIVVGGVILAAGLAAPALRGADKRAAEKAAELAALAQRQLARYSQVLPRTESLANLSVVKAGSDAVGAALENAAGPLKQVADDCAKLVRTAQREAARFGLPAPPTPTLTPDAAGVARSATALQDALKANEVLLKAALANAQSAVQADPNALGGAYAVGLAEYIRSANLLAEAQARRARQADLQVQLLDVAAQAAAARGHLDHYRGLEVTPIVSQLRSDLVEIARLREEAAADAERLARQVQERERALAELEQALQRARAEQSDLEARGFTAGDDESFRAYRERYLLLAQRLAELEIRLQEQRCGGRQGAQLDDEDANSADLAGGEALVSLDDLKQRLAAAEERARRLASANVALEEQIRFLTQSGDATGATVTHYQQVLAELDGVQRSLVEELQTLAADSFKQEEEALGAAQKSIQAFGQAQRAAEGWLREVRELQRAKDPAGKNDRLRVIVRDPYLEHLARSAEAAAQVMAGRIYAQRVDSTRMLVDDMGALAELNSDFEFDATVFENQLETAASAGLAVLGKAAETYTRMADKLGGQPTVWVPLAALAATQQLIGRIDIDQAELYAGRAEEAIAKAVEKRENFPYARTFVQFRDYLAGAKAPPPPPPGPVEEVEKDFFLDDEDE